MESAPFYQYGQYTPENPYLKDHLEEYTSQVRGVEMIDTPSRLGNNSWVSAVLLLIFIITALTIRSSAKYVGFIFGEITANKSRNSIFVTSNVGITRLKFVLILLSFFIQSLAIYLYYHYNFNITLTGNTLMRFLCFFLIAALAYFICQYSVYSLLGYIFASKSQISSWMNTFSSISAITGLLLIPPVLLAIYYTFSINFFLFIIGLIYFLSRGALIYKGIKIFFSGFHGLIYLILYLCTLEIAPLFIFYKGIFQVFSFVELKLF